MDDAFSAIKNCPIETRKALAVTSMLNSKVSASVDELRTEATIVLRTVEHITFDLDYFSRTIRTKTHSTTVINDIERHLAQARRNCADATAIAEGVLRTFHTQEPSFIDDIEEMTAQLRDSFALLALADSAYLRAFEVASTR